MLGAFTTSNTQLSVSLSFMVYRNTIMRTSISMLFVDIYSFQKSQYRDLLDSVVLGVPAFHSYGHGMTCQVKHEL